MHSNMHMHQTMQQVPYLRAGQFEQVLLPDPADEVVPGVAWGSADEVLTPAYWVVRTLSDDNPLHGFARAHSSFLEEVGFCLLGGFGITAELNHAFFESLKAAGVFEPNRMFSAAQIEELLRAPAGVGGKPTVYRYPRQRAVRLAKALPVVGTHGFAEGPHHEVRQRLLGLSGVGPKTASWILRNHYGCNEVAILDIHVVRACRVMGLFPANSNISKEYAELEAIFLEFASAVSISASKLDAVIWSEMRGYSPSLLARLDFQCV